MMSLILPLTLRKIETIPHLSSDFIEKTIIKFLQSLVGDESLSINNMGFLREEEYDKMRSKLINSGLATLILRVEDCLAY